jgi:Regulator of G protein signaling domain
MHVVLHLHCINTAVTTIITYILTAVYHNHQQVFTAMLFDYLPGFITSEHLNQAKTGITSGDALKELLETGVRSAKTTSTTSTSTPPVMIDSPMKPSSRKQLLSSADSLLLQSYDSREANASSSVTAAAAAVAASANSSTTSAGTTADTYAAIDETPSEHSRALLASMQLHAVVSDPCCSMYLESYLSKVTARSKKPSSKASIKSDMPAEVQVHAFAPDLIMACLLEIDDFKRAEDRAHRNHRAQLIISRYGIPEFDVQDLIQMRTACVREVDPSAFDLVYVLLSTRLLIEHAQGFIESSEFNELDRVLQQQNAFTGTGDTASKVGYIRNFVLEKLGLKESVHTSSTVAVAAQNEALQNVEDLLQTLEGVLSLALGRSLFKRFSTQQFQEENVCFFLEVMFYKLESYLTPAEGSVIYADRTNVPEKQLQNNNSNSSKCKIVAQGEMELSEMRRLRAEHIAAKYIEVGSKRQINISSAMRHIILDGVKPRVTATLNDDGTTTTSGGNSNSSSANMSYDKSKQGVKSRLQIGGFASMTSLDNTAMTTDISNTTGTTTATTTSSSGRCAASERTAAGGRKASTTGAAPAPPATAVVLAPPVTAAVVAVADDTITPELVSDTVCTQSDYDAAVWTPGLNVFDVAQKEVLHLMKQNLWLKFTASPLYSSLVRQISKRATIGVMVRAGKISTALVQGATKHQQ